jgi:hypothetical protein
MAAPKTAAESKAAIRGAIESLAVIGAPNVLGALEGGATIAWSRESLEPRLVPQGMAPVPGVFAILAWLAKDSLIERLEAEIDELADDSRAPSAAQRSTRERDLLARALMAERREVAAIEHAERSGVVIAMRSDCDIRGVLSLADEVLEEV